MQSSHSPARLKVTFDDDHAVANAGLALVSVLSDRLGLEERAETLIDRKPFPGRRVATLVHAMVAGAEFIDDADVLGSGSTAGVLGHKVMAPSTLGTFLRRFTFGHVRQLDRLGEEILTQAWKLGAGPGDEPMTIDLESTICEVHGTHKRAPVSATPRCAATTHCWRQEQDVARCSTSAFGRDRPALAEEPSGSAESSSDGAAEAGRAGSSRCAPTPASTPAMS
jgi:hypothetical protein